MSGADDNKGVVTNIHSDKLDIRQSPCIGYCSTSIGDDVCFGCHRFANEIINWNRYSDSEQQSVLKRINTFKTLAVKDTLIIEDADLLMEQANKRGIKGDSIELIAWNLMDKGAASMKQLSAYGLRSKHENAPVAVKRDLDRQVRGASKEAFIQGLWTDFQPPEVAQIMNLYEAVRSAFEHFGWQPWAGSVPSCVAVKLYETIAGKSEAHVRARELSDDVAEGLLITGEYYSEGLNVISTCTARFMSSDSKDTVNRKVSAFIDNAELSINQSYARKLFISGSDGHQDVLSTRPFGP